MEILTMTISGKWMIVIFFNILFCTFLLSQMKMHYFYEEKSFTMHVILRKDAWLQSPTMSH